MPIPMEQLYHPVRVCDECYGAHEAFLSKEKTATTPPSQVADDVEAAEEAVEVEAPNG